ncbi:MAG: hypothetical protein WC343_02810 [Bacilli bacterium]|jgi:hypothetical protein
MNYELNVGKKILKPLVIIEDRFCLGDKDGMITLIYESDFKTFSKIDDTLIIGSKRFYKTDYVIGTDYPKGQFRLIEY